MYTTDPTIWTAVLFLRQDLFMELRLALNLCSSCLRPGCRVTAVLPTPQQLPLSSAEVTLCPVHSLLSSPSPPLLFSPLFSFTYFPSFFLFLFSLPSFQCGGLNPGPSHWLQPQRFFTFCFETWLHSVTTLPNPGWNLLRQPPRCWNCGPNRYATFHHF